MKKKLAIILTLVVVALLGVMLFGSIGSGAYFSEQVTSNGKYIEDGTLDLIVDNGVSNVAKFNDGNLSPGNQSIGIWNVKNAGTTTGFLDLENIVITQTGGTYNDAEGEAGDTVNAGNLGELLDALVFVDVDGDSYFDIEDARIYEGTLGGLASNYDLNLPLAAGGISNIAIQINWQPHDGTIDNKGQGDTFSFDITFKLSQTNM